MLSGIEANLGVTEVGMWAENCDSFIVLPTGQGFSRACRFSSHLTSLETLHTDRRRHTCSFSTVAIGYPRDCYAVSKWRSAGDPISDVGSGREGRLETR